MSFVGDLVGRVFDGAFGFAHCLLCIALELLCDAFRAETIVTDDLADALLCLASCFVGLAFDFVGGASHDVLLRG